MHLFSRAPDDDHSDRVISFPTRGTETSERPARRKTARPRKARRRRQTTPWVQRNALSIAAVSILVAVLALGFGLAQFVTRPDSTQALLAVPADQASLAVPPASVASQDPGPTAVPVPEGPRAIQPNATVLQPNYTVQSGDTLGRIATQFNTTVDRIQAFNNLADPRVLRVGTKLVIPPPL